VRVKRVKIALSGPTQEPVSLGRHQISNGCLLFKSGQLAPMFSFTPGALRPTMVTLHSCCYALRPWALNTTFRSLTKNE
jgi:hypothetical protein